MNFLRSLVVLYIALNCEATLHDNDWDYLIFSQKWPASFCIHYDHGNSKGKCLMPKDQREWTIHGVWPSRFSEDGPFYCDPGAVFDVDKIAPIRERLEEFWPNLEGDKSLESLWEHEWLKHGTCAVNFEPLNNERKYFEMGLQLYEKYNMTSLLPILNVFPDQTKELNVIDIIDGLEKQLNGAPFAACVREGKDRNFILFELRICLNKNLEIIDCGDRDIKDGRFRPLTNCPASGIIYPKSPNLKLPSHPESVEFKYL